MRRRSRSLRVRHLIAIEKIQTGDTQWRTTDAPPRHVPFLVRTKPIRAGWKWRSARALAGTQEFVLTGFCNPSRDKWQAVLSVNGLLGWSVVSRFEHHGDHPGLHVHAHCARGGVEVGASGMDGLVRVPPVKQRHRRVNAWTETTFWEAARQHYRINQSQGPLFDYVARAP